MRIFPQIGMNIQKIFETDHLAIVFFSISPWPPLVAGRIPRFRARPLRSSSSAALRSARLWARCT